MVSKEVSAHRVLSSDKRVAMLHALQESPVPLGIECLARAVDLHVNTTREHLDRLIASGYVTRAAEQRTTRGRPRILYRAADDAPRVTSDARARDQLLRLLLAGYGQQQATPEGTEGVAEEAGCAWGHSVVAGENRSLMGDLPAPDDHAGAPQVPEPHHDPDGSSSCPAEVRQLTALTDHLAQLGFDPVSDLEALKVHLHRCPYLDIAQERPEVVCNVHLGLARGVLEESGGPLTADRLEPMTDGSDCVLHLARVAQTC